MRGSFSRHTLPPAHERWGAFTLGILSCVAALFLIAYFVKGGSLEVEGPVQPLIAPAFATQEARKLIVYSLVNDHSQAFVNLEYFVSEGMAQGCPACDYVVVVHAGNVQVRRTLHMDFALAYMFACTVYVNARKCSKCLDVVIVKTG